MKNSDIKIKRYGRTVLICIDRPSSLNAFTPSTVEELNEAIDEFENDNELWTAVLTGSGEKAFCVGADLKWMASNLDAKREDWKTHEGIWKKMTVKPIIAAVNGYCLGGGMEIALCCDLIIATRNSSFGLPELKNAGSFPGDGGLFRLPRQIPLRIAMDMLLTDKRLSAKEALELGLVNQIVKSDDLIKKALEKAEQINKSSPIAVRLTKNLVYSSLDLPLNNTNNLYSNSWDLYDVAEKKLHQSEDWKSGEGPKSFLEKRSANWTGK